MDGASKRRLAATSTRSGIGPSAFDSHAPLLEAIAANPDETSAWAVYADLLQTDGHPRGELIALMLERERRPSARLFAIQRRMLAAHASILLPTALPPEVVVGWRRGFASELRIVAPEQLAAIQREPSLRFVEAATLVIDAERWSDWREALAVAKLPWRRLRIDGTRADSTLEVSAMLACCPAAELLRIALPSDGCELSWDGARAEQLRLLVLVDAGEVGSLDDAELPRLEELRLLGDSVASDELCTSLRWNRLQRVVLAEGAGVETGDPDGPSVRVLVPTGRAERAELEEDEDEAWDNEQRDTSEATTAFVVVGRAVEPALLRKLAEPMSIAQLSARVARVRWLPRPVTVIQLFGTADAELLPYGLAIALHNVLEGAPVALVEVDADRAARYLVLGDPPARGTHGQPAGEVQRALDLAVGCDLGAAVLEDVLHELGAAPVERLLGNGGTCQLVMIDPSTAPLVIAEDEEDADYDDDDEDEDGDDWDFGDDLDEQYEEPLMVEDDLDEEEVRSVDAPKPPHATAAIAVMTPTVTLEFAPASLADHVERDDEPEALESRTCGDEDALVTPPERTELWLEFREHWDDRALDVDDEPGELRWPDPERVSNDLELYLERQVAEPKCARHDCALDHCSCGARYCVECDGEDRCASCAAVLAGKPTIDDSVPVPRVTV